jgi:hypothetical protein
MFEEIYVDGGEKVTEDGELFGIKRDDMTDGRLVRVDDEDGLVYLVKFFGVEMGELDGMTSTKLPTTVTQTTHSTTPSVSPTSTPTVLHTTTTTTLQSTRTVTTTPTVSPTVSPTSTKTSTPTSVQNITEQWTTTEQTVTPTMTLTKTITVTSGQRTDTTVSLLRKESIAWDNVGVVVGCVVVLLIGLVNAIVYRKRRIRLNRLRPLPLNNPIYTAVVHEPVPPDRRIDLTLYD